IIERIIIFFFFQAEDGIRYFHVTGVQTCALPISPVPVVEKAHRTTSHRAGTDRAVPAVCRVSAPPLPGPAYCRHPVLGRRAGREIGRASCRESMSISEVAGAISSKNMKTKTNNYT